MNINPSLTFPLNESSLDIIISESESESDDENDIECEEIIEKKELQLLSQVIKKWKCKKKQNHFGFFWYLMGFYPNGPSRYGSSLEEWISFQPSFAELKLYTFKCPTNNQIHFVNSDTQKIFSKYGNKLASWAKETEPVITLVGHNKNFFDYSFTIEPELIKEYSSSLLSSTEKDLFWQTFYFGLVIFFEMKHETFVEGAQKPFDIKKMKTGQLGVHTKLRQNVNPFKTFFTHYWKFCCFIFEKKKISLSLCGWLIFSSEKLLTAYFKWLSKNLDLSTRNNYGQGFQKLIQFMRDTNEFFKTHFRPMVYSAFYIAGKNRPRKLEIEKKTRIHHLSYEQKLKLSPQKTLTLNDCENLIVKLVETSKTLRKTLLKWISKITKSSQQVISQSQMKDVIAFYNVFFLILTTTQIGGQRREVFEQLTIANVIKVGPIWSITPDFEEKTFRIYSSLPYLSIFTPTFDFYMELFRPFLLRKDSKEFPFFGYLVTITGGAMSGENFYLYLKRASLQYCGKYLTSNLIRHMKSTFSVQHARTLPENERIEYLENVAAAQNHTLTVLMFYYNDDMRETERDKFFQIENYQLEERIQKKIKERKEKEEEKEEKKEKKKEKEEEEEEEEEGDVIEEEEEDMIEEEEGDMIEEEEEDMIEEEKKDIIEEEEDMIEEEKEDIFEEEERNEMLKKRKRNEMKKEKKKKRVLCLDDWIIRKPVEVE